MSDIRKLREAVAPNASIKPFDWVGGSDYCRHIYFSELGDGLRSCIFCGAVSRAILKAMEAGE